MRHFRHLTGSEIRGIIAAYIDGSTQAEIARQYNVDHSTINYHVTKYERAYPEQGGIYSVIKIRARATCAHPSSRCVFCGQMWDQLARGERETIRVLTERLADAHSRLRVAGLPVE